ncbi:MAG TPA: helix-turn-helix transcriptional regulator [Fimbriimonadaceae bacterium]|nr:helix-turn-helix transcriptional regulator [Fimbriimonadaceae bacterium]HRJ32239.1 helix-turn-helix transcriptional regulator [Fimbriimonadaceae bacterium]
MSNSCHTADRDVLVRFWILDHHRAEAILWGDTEWIKLIFAVEGTILLETSSTHHVLPSNRAMILAPNQPHTARTAGRAKVRTLFFNPSLLESVISRPVEVRPLLGELIAEACRVGPLQRARARHAELTTLLIAEIVDAPSIPIGIAMPSTEWAQHWAQEFLAEPESAHPPPVSKRTLERVMLRETNLTLGQWCRQARTLVGLRALSEGATVLEAGIAAGFATSSGFIHSFRRQFGVTPGRIFRRSPSKDS